MEEAWFDAEGSHYEAREASCGALCERCEGDETAVSLAVVEVLAWDPGGGYCGSLDLCQAHYEELRAAR